MRGPDETVVWLHGDHLGSTSLATDAGGALLPGSDTRYYPFGQVRAGGGLPTDFGYTGQRLDATGLMFYHARYYAPQIGRFVQADTVVPEPGEPQNFNRYSYVRNNPLAYIDPSGHIAGNPPTGGTIYDPAVGMLSAGQSPPPDWLLYYMYLWALEDPATDHWVDYTFEEWGPYNVGLAMRNAANMAKEDGIIDDDTYWEWWGTGIMIQSSDPTTRGLIGLQEGYNVELGLMFSSMLPSFDAWFEYSNYWTFPGEAYPTLPSSERVMLHEGKQGKHIPGHNNYIPGKSILTHPDPQALLDSYAGTGTPVRGTYGQSGFVERVDFGQDIGLWVDQSTGVSAPTSIGRIHYSSNGAHIVPTRPW